MKTKKVAALPQALLGRGKEEASEATRNSNELGPKHAKEEETFRISICSIVVNTTSRVDARGPAFFQQKPSAATRLALSTTLLENASSSSSLAKKTRRAAKAPLYSQPPTAPSTKLLASAAGKFVKDDEDVREARAHRLERTVQ
ncbi:hypothetical protein CPB85DRAFT_1257746 [Mucidula mucida]|nr:hypothetical protein CPB85DRAFT_1257746 [Mucidula mucida]